jgi:hypothetical protein
VRCRYYVCTARVHDCQPKSLTVIVLISAVMQFSGFWEIILMCWTKIFGVNLIVQAGFS